MNNWQDAVPGIRRALIDELRNAHSATTGRAATAHYRAAHAYARTLTMLLTAVGSLPDGIASSGFCNSRRDYAIVLDYFSGDWPEIMGAVNNE